MSSSMANLKKYRIPLEEIVRATNNFSSETKIGDGGFGSVYKGKLSEQWQNRTLAIKRLNRDGYQGNKEFYNELEMVASFDHPNIITFIGFCDEANQMIIVYDYAINGSLDYHIQDPDKRRCLTWEQRLKICLGAARGFEYFHSGLGEHRRVIHRDVKSANILLDDNLDAKICDFGLSKFGARNQENTQLLTKAAGTRFYMDPLYAERIRLTKESDVYSFGVVMFELSSGTLAYHRRCFDDDDDKPQYLMDVVRSYYDDQENAYGPEKLIDPFIRGHIDMRSFHIFNNIANECVKLKLKERPTMDQIIRKINQALEFQLAYQTVSSLSTRSLESFVISLEDIKLATKCFSKEICRDAVFGNVYKGQLPKLWPNPIAIKRLYQGCYRGKNEFYNELKLISCFHNQNILHFIGYCDEANERIVVHEYALNGSLGDHLQDQKKCRSLTWTQRLKICIGTTRALRYLQLYLGEDNEMIHGKINSRNIMLDESMEAKVSFFGLSKQGCFYDKPIRSKKSDMLSLGIILCEVLSGYQASRYISWGDSEDELRRLHLFVKDYRNGQLEKFIDDSISKQLDSRCYETLKELAYQCIITDNLWTQDSIHAIIERNNQEAPPSIDTFIERLEYAAHVQMSDIRMPVSFPSSITKPNPQEHQSSSVQSDLDVMTEIKWYQQFLQGLDI